MRGREQLTGLLVNPKHDVELEVIHVDETVRAALAVGAPPPPMEEGHWRASSIVDLVVVRCGLPSVASASCPNAVVGVGADDDGEVPECLGGGAPHSLARCSTL